MAPRISTTYGSRLAAAPPGIVIPANPASASALASRLHAEATEAEAEGRWPEADRLQLLIYAVRGRAAIGVRE